MTKINTLSGNAALSVGHMAGMIDLAALPLWITALMESYKLQAPQAGLTVTLFLLGVVISSIFLASKFEVLPRRHVSFFGFSLSASCFITIAILPIDPHSFFTLLILHFAAGLGSGSALSVTHGCIGRSENPHRLFGIVNVAMGVLAIIMFAVLPGLMHSMGAHVIFIAFSITMAVAAVSAILFFPDIETPSSNSLSPGAVKIEVYKLHGTAWLIIVVIACLALSQAIVFSYLDRIGDVRGFSKEKIQTLLVVMGFVNLLPGILAALLQKHLSPFGVGIAGLCLQGACALAITNSHVYQLFAAPAAVYVTLTIFTHTFLFGVLSKIDPTGRAVAATPAMMMTGSALGPVLGGLIVTGVGYGGLGCAVLVIACFAIGLLLRARYVLNQSNESAMLANS